MDNINQSPKIVFEDPYIAVIDKPAGMIVNNADTSKKMYTLQDWVFENIKIEKTEDMSVFNARNGIVHRLDKETSGLIIIAKNEQSFKNLQEQFKSGNVSKVYIALVHGKVVPNEGEINVPIGRLPWNRMRFGVLAEGRESKTLYKVIGDFSATNAKISGNEKDENTYSLVEVYPKTGRTHQIRVHFKHLGYPIVSDSLYVGRKISKKDRKILSRHFLHAKKIFFQHPNTQKKVSFESELPPELVDFMRLLG